MHLPSPFQSFSSFNELLRFAAFVIWTIVQTYRGRWIRRQTVWRRFPVGLQIGMVKTNAASSDKFRSLVDMNPRTLEIHVKMLGKSLV